MAADALAPCVQDISSHDIDQVSPCLTWGRISTTCVISVWRIDIKCKCMFMFPLENLACKGLIILTSGRSPQCIAAHPESGISRYAFSQWEMALQCNNDSHWLGAHLAWSLRIHCCWGKLLVTNHTNCWRHSPGHIPQSGLQCGHQTKFV